MRETTSASNLARRRLCPGSGNAEANIIDESSPAADDGTLLHPFAENPSLPRDHLSEAHRALLARVDANHAELLSLVSHACDGAQMVFYPKTRLTVQDVHCEPMFSGENDFVMYEPVSRTVVIEDYKLGYVTVTQAKDNLQICIYALMWADYLEAQHAIVAINQPRAKESLTVARYTKDQLDQARLEITAIYRASQQPDAPRIAGEEQCRFCKAQLHCEEYIRKFRPLDLKPDAVTIEQLDKDRLIYLFEAVKFAERIADKVKAEMTRRIEVGDPDFSEWELAETGSTRTQMDVIGIYQELSRFFEGNPDFSGERFTACTKLNLTELTKLVKDLSGMNEARAKKLLNVLIEPYATWAPKKPTPRLKAQS